MIRALVFLMIWVFTGFQIGCTSTQKKEEPKVVGFAIAPPIQYPSTGVPIQANRTSVIWGDHDRVQGMDAGIIGNIVNKEFNGSAVSGFFHITSGKADIVGVQFSGVANVNQGKTKIEGFQLSLGWNYAGDEQRVIGFQVAGLGNIGYKNKVYGVQAGAYNQAEAIYGFQIGLVNSTKNLYGIQIGALNFSSKNGMAFFPLINAGF